MTIEKEAAAGTFLLSQFGWLVLLEGPIWCMLRVVWARAGDLIWGCCELVAITLCCCWLELRDEVFYSFFLLSILPPGGCTWGLKNAGKKQETLLGMLEVGLNSLVAMPEILVLLVLLYKLSVSLSHQRLLLPVAYENDKPLLSLTSFIQRCCLMLLLHVLHQLQVM